MDRNKWILLAIIGLLVLLSIIFLLPEKTRKKYTKTGSEESDFSIFSSSQGYADTIYPEAPLPFVEEPSLEEEAIQLWPTAIRSVKDEKHKEKVREEWKDFASRYPSNIYILNEYKPALSKKEEEKAIANLETFTEVESFYARVIASSKYAETGVEPKTSNEPKISPAFQKLFFDYKIQELESRIQLMEYAKENKALSSEQETMAEKEIREWKKEIEKLKEVAKTVPNT